MVGTLRPDAESVKRSIQNTREPSRLLRSPIVGPIGKQTTSGLSWGGGAAEGGLKGGGYGKGRSERAGP